MDIVPTFRLRSRRGVRRAAIVAGAALVISGVLTTSALGRPAGSITVTVPDGTFAGTTVAAVAGPGLASTQEGGSYWVRNQCFQDGSRVLTQYVRADASGHAELTLGPTDLWTGGGATCTASYGSFGSSGRWKTLASDTFSVDG